MVNYKAIADEASNYSDYQTAFNAMSIETEEKYRELSSNNLREWAVLNPDDYKALKASNDVISEIGLKYIDAPPLDMRKDTVRGFVSQLSISVAGKAALVDLATISVKVWEGLKVGHVQNALQKRAEGRV